MALLGRVVPRDLYDAANLAHNPESCSTGDIDLDRKIMLFCLTMSEPFPRPIMIRERFAGIQKEVDENLIPVLLSDNHPQLEEMIETVEGYVLRIMQLATDSEREYVDLMRRAVFKPELLFGADTNITHRALANPAMKWKLENLAHSLLAQN